MCRFTLYLGPPIRVAALLFEPEHSLIRQSTHSRERSEPLNGDGFGLGWYAPEIGPEPAVFRSITPAWNNRNLASLAQVVTTPCMLAHVRAATSASGVNEANCHPFRFGRLLFMHNGDVGEFRRVRRQLLDSVCDEAFNNVYGSTDSEHVFALVIDELARSQEEEPAARLASALRRAIWRTVDLVDRYGDGAPCILNLALSDGEHAVVSRFTVNSPNPPESLYLYRGGYPLTAAGSERSARSGEEAILVSSERLGKDPHWTAIPANHLVVVARGREPLLTPCVRDEPAFEAA